MSRVQYTPHARKGDGGTNMLAQYRKFLARWIAAGGDEKGWIKPGALKDD